MDGYHYPLEVLRTMMNTNPVLGDLIYRRGAPDTFDTFTLSNDLQRIRSKMSKSSKAFLDDDDDIIYIPGFDHSKGDPSPREHKFIRDEHQVVIMEGLYLHLTDIGDEIEQDAIRSVRGWNDISIQFDLKIFIDADLNSCIERLKIRNKCIPGYTPEEIDVRCDVVDRSNALIVLSKKSHADLVVRSCL